MIPRNHRLASAGGSCGTKEVKKNTSKYVHNNITNQIECSET